MSNKTVQILFDAVLKNANIELTDAQSVQFLHACHKTIAENPTLDFQQHQTVARIYLNFVLNFDTLDLGSIQEPVIEPSKP